MALRDYAGNAKPSTLVAGISNVALAFDIPPADAGSWPTGGANGKFFVTIDRGLPSEERLLANSQSGGSFTISALGDRGLDGTSTVAHSAGATVEHTYSAVDSEEANAHINNVALDHHTQYMLASGTRHDLTARHSAGTVVPTAAPVAIGTALAEGGGTTLARAAHVHTVGVGVINNANMFASGVIDAAAIATDAVGSAEIAPDAVGASEIAAGAVGTSELAAGVYGATAQTVGSSNSAGAAATLSRSDHIHATYSLGHLAAPVRRSIDQGGMGSGLTDFTGLAITVTVGTSRRIRIRGHVYVENTTGNSNCDGVVREGSTILGKFGWFRADDAFESAVLEGSVTLEAPSPGLHTYKLSMASSGGSTFSFLGATDTGWIECLDEGPV